MSAPNITACICTCDRYELLDTALVSLAAQTLPRSRYEILVVDTTDAGRRARGMEGRMRRAGVRYVKAAGMGLSEARNRALRQCRSPVIAFMDDDATADRDWLGNLLARFARIPDLGAIGGRVEANWEVPPPAWLPRSLFGYLSILDWGDDEIDIGPKQYLAGTNIAFRVSAARKPGGFRPYLGRHPGILLSNEETELCGRISGLGLRVIYTPAAKVRHLASAERCTQAWIRRRVAWQAISNLMSGTLLPDNPESLLSSIDTFFRMLKSETRDPRMLSAELADPSSFEAQCNAIYAYIILFGREHTAVAVSL